MQPNRKPAGEQLREWRSKRRMSQLELASEAEISARHLSFLETGRSQASREMLLHLSEQLDIPLRERNVILVAAGYAPVFEERPLASPKWPRRARRSDPEAPQAAASQPSMTASPAWAASASDSRRVTRRMRSGVLRSKP